MSLISQQRRTSDVLNLSLNLDHFHAGPHPRITGQDGSYLEELLLPKGHEVYDIVRSPRTFNTTRKSTVMPDLICEWKKGAIPPKWNGQAAGRIVEHLEGLCHDLTGCGKTISAQQHFDGLHVWDKPGLSGPSGSSN